MNKYLSIVFLYNRASYKKLLLIAGGIPLCLLAIFLLKIGNPHEADPFMLMERAFGGVWAVLLFIAALVLGLASVSTSLSGKKAVKGECSTTGFTIRRLCMSPVVSYLIMFVYYLIILVVFWGIAIASLYIIGRAGLAASGAEDVSAKLALGLLRTEIGHVLIPAANPLVIIFDIVVVLALAAECARGCYLGWHNGTLSAGVALIIIPAFVIWTYFPKNSYMIVTILIVFLYAALSFADMIFREKRPKGDPFKVNKHDGIVDMDGTEYDDEVFLEVNTSADVYDASDGTLILERYGKAAEGGRKRRLHKANPFWLRRRYMPLGSNMEKINAFFGVCIFTGIAAHFVFYGKYMMKMNEITGSIKGVTIDNAVRMTPFWELQEHAYYGYILAVLMALFFQAYSNYRYYNKTTKSVYVMKRLPACKEYRRTIWIGPLIQALIIAAVMFIQTLADLCLYIFITPDIALPADYLSQIIPF